MIFQTVWWYLSEYFVYTAVLLSITVLVGYYYGTSTYDYWKKKGVPYIKPKYPFLGTTYETIFCQKSASDLQQEIYNYFKGERFTGIFSIRKPVLMIFNPEIVELVLVKDFSSFINRGNDKEVKKQPLQAHLLNLEDNEWKSLRQKLTPTFSSGKIKGMHQQLIDCSENLVEHIRNFLEKSEPIEVRESMAKFTTDVIGSCAFGLNANALKNPNSEFRVIGRKIFQPTFISKLRFALASQYPKLVKLLRWGGSNALVFSNILQQTMAFRGKNNVVRNDFVQLLMELKKQEHERQRKSMAEEEKAFVIDDNVIASNAFIFFVAGFETTASTLSYCLYELSLHTDIQEQAYHHVVSVLKKHGGEITYDAIKEMTLIKQIFSETLRIHPPAVEIRRMVTKDYTIPGTNLTLPKGLSVAIPIYSLHNDPEYFPDPEKFKPERFEKGKENIKKGTYIPFGDGPRICIGARFAKMEMQVALVKLLLNFKFTLNPKTISPLVYNPSAVLLVPIGGIWIDVQKRI